MGQDNTVYLSDIAKQYTLLRNDLSDLEARVKTLKTTINAVENKLIEQMIIQDLQSFKSPTGTFSLRSQFYANFGSKEKDPEGYEENRGYFYTWLRKSKDFDLVVRQALTNNTIRGFVQDLLEAGKPMPPGVKGYSETVISYRKHKEE